MRRSRLVILMLLLLAATVLPARASAGVAAAGSAFRNDLARFPRPTGDNGWGIHWAPRLSAQSPEVVDRFVAEIEAMGITWVKILQPDVAKVEHEYLIRELTRRGIMPILRVYREFNTPYEHLDELVRTGRAMGVYYYELFNEPNIEGDQGGWRDGEEIDPQRMAALWLPAARSVVRAGGFPGVPALAPGGHYDDMAFLREFLEDVVEQGGAETLKSSWIGLHNYFMNHPVSYPEDEVNLYGWLLTSREIEERGLSEQEVESINYYRTVSRLPRSEGGYFVGRTVEEDSNGFRKFEAYHAIVSEVVGYQMPILSTEGGVMPGGKEDPRYPRTTDADVANRTAEAFTYMLDEAPEYYFTFTPWILANLAGGGGDDKWEGATWFEGYAGEAKPVVETIKELAATSRPRVLPTPMPTPTATRQASALSSANTSWANSRQMPTATPTVDPGKIGWLIVWRDLRAFNCLPVRLSAAAPVVRTWNAPADGHEWGLEMRDSAGLQMSWLGSVPAISGGMPGICNYIPTPQPTPTPTISPLPAREWDERLDLLHIQVVETDAPSGSVYWRLVSAKLEDDTESGGRHHIYIKMIDENDRPVAGAATVSWADGSETFSMVYEEGPSHYVDKYAEWGANFPMYGETGSYCVRAVGEGDMITGLGMPGKRHVNYLLVFQRTTVP